MRWTLIIVMTFVSVAAAQQPPSRTPPPPGVDISARDGDRIVVDDDARIQVVRRRQATVRTIFNQEERLLIVLVDYSKPGEFPDGGVDWAFSFHDVEGTWPLGQRWEALTTIFEYHGYPPQPQRFGLATPQGLVQLSSGPPGMNKPDPTAIAGLRFGASSSSLRRGLSFAEAEKIQLAEAAEDRHSRAMQNDSMTRGPAGASVTGRGSPSATMGSAVVTGEIRMSNGAPRKIRDIPPIYPEAARQANVSGVVILQLTVGVNGTVTNARVVRSVPLLDAAAIEAAKQWLYEPTGRTTSVMLTVAVPIAP